MCNRTIAISVALLLVLASGPMFARAQFAAESWAGDGAATSDARLSADELAELLAPIALYPDVLLAQILPAATYPLDIVKAARLLRQNADLNKLDEQDLDPSVLSIARYPEILSKMDQDLDWTNALGAAFLSQPDDVMDVIQDLRAQARASGALRTTPQETVTMDQDVIRIVPTEPQVVYVPEYDPATVYVDTGTFAAPSISFGVAVSLGAWLDKDCDWNHRHVVYCRPGYWGGYTHRGMVAWGSGWTATVGRHSAVVIGDRGGTAWSRYGTHGRPMYTGRYSLAPSGSHFDTGHPTGIDQNRNTIPGLSLFRGLRNLQNLAIRGHSPVPRPGGDQPRLLNRSPARVPTPRSSAAGAQRPSAFGGVRPNSDVRRQSERGAQSRDAVRPRPNPPAPRPAAPPPSVNRPTPTRSGSAFRPGGSNTSGASNRGAASRGGANPAARRP
jgi:hypothetical protein